MTAGKAPPGAPVPERAGGKVFCFFFSKKKSFFYSPATSPLINSPAAPETVDDSGWQWQQKRAAAGSPPR
jgi:hypothetical protein